MQYRPMCLCTVCQSADAPVYGGFKLNPDHPQQFVLLFPQILCALRQALLQPSTTNSSGYELLLGITEYNIIMLTSILMQWRRQRSKGARSFRGQKIPEPGHPDALFPPKSLRLF